MDRPLPLVQLCGQLILGGYVGEQPTPTFLKAIHQGQRGGAVLFRRNLPSLEAAWEACAKIASAAPQEYPVWLSLDEEGGRVRRLPSPFLRLPPMLRLAGLGEDSLLERAGKLVGAQLRVLGFNLNLAPVLDVHTRESNPVIGDRAFGTDAQAASRGALAYLRGLRLSGMVGCGKHFPGHGDTTVDSHVGLPVVNWGRDRLEAVELIPFRAAIAAGIECLMSAHIVCTSLDASAPATLSKSVATGLLREQLGYKGVLLSDDLEMRAIAARPGVAEGAVQAIEAGCDAVLICSREDLQEEALGALVRESSRSEEFRKRCEQAAGRCLAVRKAHSCAGGAAFAQVQALVEGAEAREFEEEVAERTRQGDLSLTR